MIIHHHQTMDSINARLGAICRHLTGSDPGTDDPLDVEVVLNDSNYLTEERSKNTSGN